MNKLAVIADTRGNSRAMIAVVDDIRQRASVGLPAYWNDEPLLHKVEASSPHARYAFLHKAPDGWSIDHVAVPYLWDPAAAAARRSGREDRAGFVETGRAEIPDNLPLT